MWIERLIIARRAPVRKFLSAQEFLKVSASQALGMVSGWLPRGISYDAE